MRFLPVVLCAAALIVVPLLSDKAGAVPIESVGICHVNAANDVIDLGGGLVQVFGRVIAVAPRAVPAHLAHGDSLDFRLLAEEDRDHIEQQFGISLPNAGCYAPLP